MGFGGGLVFLAGGFFFWAGLFFYDGVKVFFFSSMSVLIYRACVISKDKSDISPIKVPYLHAKKSVL